MTSGAPAGASVSRRRDQTPALLLFAPQAWPQSPSAGEDYCVNTFLGPRQGVCVSRPPGRSSELGGPLCFLRKPPVVFLGWYFTVLEKVHPRLGSKATETSLFVNFPRRAEKRPSYEGPLCLLLKHGVFQGTEPAQRRGRPEIRAGVRVACALSPFCHENVLRIVYMCC